MDKFSIKDKVAIVTGGVDGIGSACVYGLLTEGAKFVAIFDVDTSEEVWFHDIINKFGLYRAELYHCDVSNEKEFRFNFDQVIKKHKYVDILINNAGVGNENDAGRLIDVNVKGTIVGNMIAIEYMGKHKGGKGGVIVNIASVIGLLDCHVLPIYSASKHAVVSFTRSMKENCERIGIKIFAICPGHTRTKLNEELSHKDSHNYLDFVSKDYIRNFQAFQVQSPNNVSDAIIKLISTADPGTVWVVANNESSFRVCMTIM